MRFGRHDDINVALGTIDDQSLRLFINDQAFPAGGALEQNVAGCNGGESRILGVVLGCGHGLVTLLQI